LNAPVPTINPPLLKEHISEYLKTVTAQKKIGIFYLFISLACFLKQRVEEKRELKKESKGGAKRREKRYYLNFMFDK